MMMMVTMVMKEETKEKVHQYLISLTMLTRVHRFTLNVTCTRTHTRHKNYTSLSLQQSHTRTHTNLPL